MVNAATNYAVLAMEYRGYSIHEGTTSFEAILEDASSVMNYLTLEGMQPEQIILLGRSIGCAVALSIAHQYHPKCIVLLSPFISLKKIAQDLYGSCAGFLLKDIFENEEKSGGISCPTLIIHGMQDTLVSYEHSLMLLSKCRSFCKLKLIEHMTHTRFNFRNDFILHVEDFLAALG